jgi:hypothetical protein
MPWAGKDGDLAVTFNAADGSVTFPRAGVYLVDVHPGYKSIEANSWHRVRNKSNCFVTGYDSNYGAATNRQDNYSNGTTNTVRALTEGASVYIEQYVAGACTFNNCDCFITQLSVDVPYLVANGNGVVSDPRQGYVSINEDLTMSVNGIFSSDNHNLIDNPDFAINQRGLTGYQLNTGQWTGYLDRWKGVGSSSTPSTLTKVAGGIQVTRGGTDIVTIRQCMESKAALPSPLTMSVSVAGTVYSYTTAADLSTQSIRFNVKTKAFSIGTATDTPELEIVRLVFNDYAVGETSQVINWVKLEAGYAATPFVKPNFATEMYKCQRYLAPISIVSEIVVKDGETILSKFFHLRSLSSYGVYNPGNYSFYLKSLDGLTISAGVLPTSFLRFYNSTEGNIRVMIRPLFPAGMAGVNNMNITPAANDNIVTEPNPAQPVLLIAEI